MASVSTALSVCGYSAATGAEVGDVEPATPSPRSSFRPPSTSQARKVGAARRQTFGLREETLDRLAPDLGPGEVGPGEVGPGRLAPARLAPARWAPEVGPGEVGPGEVGPGEAGPGEVGPGEVGPGEVGPGEVGPGEVGPGEVGPGEWSARRRAPAR